MRVTRPLRLTILLLVAAVSLAAGLGAPGAASVQAQAPSLLVFGLVNDCGCDPANPPNTLIRFNSTSPNNVTVVGPINGLGDNDFMATIAFRPSNGRLYGLSANGYLYTIHTSTAVATLVNPDPPFNPNGIPSISFDPVTDTIRLITTSQDNVSINPDTGALIAQDTDLQGCGAPIGLANTAAFPGAAATTLFTIDVCDATLVRIGGPGGVPSPNTGQITVIGPLNLPNEPNEPDLLLDASIAISGGSQQVALASLMTYESIVDNLSRLFSVDLTTGQATLIGPIVTPGQPNLVSSIAFAPSGAIRMRDAAVRVNETAGVVNITVQRTGGAFSTATVAYATADGTGVAGVDYVAQSGTISFAEGETTKTVAVVLIPTAGPPGTSKTFTLNLSTPSPNVQLLAGASQTTVTIDDNSPVPAPQIQLSAGQYSVNNTAGSIAINVRRLGPSGTAVGISYATSNGTGQAGVDYVATNGQLAFGINEVQRQVIVPILINPGAGGSRTFTLTLSNPTGGATLGTPASATVTIIDDAAVVPTVQLATDAVSVPETGIAATVQVWRLGNVAGASTVQFATANGTALAGRDYQARSGTLNFSAGQTNLFITVPLIPTAGGQGNKTFSITLSNPTGGTLATPSTATVTILDPGSPPSIQFNLASVSVDESAGFVVLTVDRSGNTASQVSVAFATRDGTAIAGTDYTATSGTLQFLTGFASATINVPITNRVGPQGTRVFQVDLSGATGGAVLGTPSTAAVTILDVASPATLQFSTPTLTVRDTDRLVSVRVTRQGSLAGPVSVQYQTVTGSATAGIDYTPVAGTLIFANGESEKIINVPILNDVENSPVTLGLILLSPTGNAILGQQRTIVITIVPQTVHIPAWFKFQRRLPGIAGSGG